MDHDLDHVLLIGSMGSGKTTVGRLVGKALMRPYVDNDVLLEDASGNSAKAIFDEQGRTTLNQKEASVARDAIRSKEPSVLSIAAGALEDGQTLDLVRRAGTVVYLRARPDVLVSRIASDSSRPLGKEASRELLALEERRRSLFEQTADLLVDVDDISPGEIADRIVESLWRTVHVDLGKESYNVLIGPGRRAALSSVLPPSATRVALVTTESVQFGIDVDRESSTFLVAEGESAKSITTVESLCRSFARFGLNRRDVVVAVGGGAVTDVAGFAASCYHRGVAVVHVPTTLLGQIDAAIGGKTGVNIAEGKNLIGSFYQPHAVICDTDTLFTLPVRERLSGYGEIAKYAFLGVENLEHLRLVDQVAACVELKAAITREDEREDGRRVILNYGHTLAHALEAESFDGRGDIRHGEAVAIGLLFAARLARRLGRIDSNRVDRHLEVLTSYGLDPTLPPNLDFDAIIRGMKRDKKASSGLTFVLDGKDGVESVAGVEEGLVREELSLFASSRGEQR